MGRIVKKCIASLLIFAVCLSFFGCGSKGAKNSYRGADSPEEVISEFIQAISNKESKEELLKFCPAEWVAENYNISDLPEQAKIYKEPEFHLENFQTQLPVLVGSLFLQEDGNIAEGYNLPDGFDPTREDAMRIMMENTDFFIQQLREPIIMLQCDPAFVAENASQSIEYFEINTQRLGVQDMAERIALIEYEGKTYMTGFTLAQYQEKWYIITLTSQSAQLSSAPGFRRITPKDYEKRNW